MNFAVKKVRLLLLLAPCSLLLACTTPPSRATRPGEDHVAAVLSHPEAPAVARAYPAFFTHVAKLVARLEHDLAQSENR